MAKLPLIKTFVDTGNYSIQYTTNAPRAEIKTIRSIRKEITTGQRVQRYTESSPLIVYKDERIHFGTQAEKYGNPLPTAVDDKTNPNLALAMVLACLEPVEGHTEYETDLAFMLPNPDAACPGTKQSIGEVLVATLAGTHSFLRNGVQMTVKVKPRFPLYEGVAPVLMARRAGLIKANGYTLVIDIGGGTWNVCVVDSDGDVIDQESLDKMGGVRVAAILQENALIKARFGDTPSLDLIMDGITRGVKSGNDQAFFLGEKPEAYFHDLLPGTIERWYQEGKLWIGGRFKAHMPKITNFLFTGGNANLLRANAAKSKLSVVYPNPENANISALASLG